MGRWIQVNFLTLDDGGVWDPDDLSGIGFVQELTETEWTLTDDFGRGCSVTLTYSVDANHRFSRQAIRAGAQCPSGIIGMRDSGRFEFSSDSRFMTEHYDLQPGDDIVAFKWLSR